MRGDTPHSLSALRKGILITSLASLLFLAPIVHAQPDAKDAEIEKLRKENEILRTSIKELQASRLAVFEQKKAIEGKIANLEFQLRLLRDRNEQLLQQIQDLTRALAGKGDPGVRPKEDKPNPPGVKVQGVIEKVDANDRSLVTLSIGGDNGLVKGHTLEVYRLKPQAKYLGTIRIVEVTPQKAVGRLVRSNAANAPALQPGDRVTSSLK